MASIPWYKYLLSFVKPVWLSTTSSETNPHLEVLLYMGRVQLGTEDALYSDGKTYAPAVLACKELKKWLPGAGKVLVLGVGLGSIVEVLYSKGYRPQCTLVERDNTILKMAMEHLARLGDMPLNPICADAEQYIRNVAKPFDLLFVDIFQGRVVPGFVTTEPFLRACRNSLAPGGRLVMNYIENDPAAWQSTLNVVRSVFPDCKILYHNINRIFVATV